MLDANLIAYLTFTTVLAVTPGSTTAVVVRNTLRGGHRAGLASAGGAAVANCVHAVLSGLGLSLLLARWPAALLAVRFAGAAFLATMGMQSLWAAFRVRRGAPAAGGSEDKGGSKDEGGSNQPTPRLRRSAEALRAKAEDPPLRTQAFREGLAFNLLNFTIISFYIAVVPTFIPVGAPWWYFGILAAAHVTIALGCHAMWAMAFHGVRRWFASSGARRALTAATGVALLLLALRVLN